MQNYKEPIELKPSHSVQVHHEDITSADAALFRTSVSFTGPNAPTWMEVLPHISGLLSCNEAYARFDQDPDNLKRWKYPPPPLHLQSAEAKAAAQAVSGSTSARMVEPALAHGHARIADLPKELREAMWLGTEEPRILGADVIVQRHEPSRPRAVIVIATSELYKRGLALGDNPQSIRNPRWDDIKLYDLGSEAHDLAVREYGQPSIHSVPFRSAVDELLLDVGLEFEPGDMDMAEFYWQGHCYRTKQGAVTWAGASVPGRCDICSSNLEVLLDPNVGAIVATEEEVPCPEAENGRQWLGDARPGQASIVLTHRTYKPASADLLNRFRKVTLQIKKNRAFNDELRLGPAGLKQTYMSLGRSLPKAFPRLETLTIRVQPMRDYTSTNRTDYDAETCHLFDGRRVHLLDALTAVGNRMHDFNCDDLHPCHCQLLPFRHLQRLVVQVSTKKMFRFIPGGRRPVREWFTDRPRLDSLFVCPKGVAPLSSNATRHPNSDIPSRYVKEDGQSFDNPRNFDFRWGDFELFRAHLNRPDSPEP